MKRRPDPWLTAAVLAYIVNLAGWAAYVIYTGAHPK